MRSQPYCNWKPRQELILNSFARYVSLFTFCFLFHKSGHYIIRFTNTHTQTMFFCQRRMKSLTEHLKMTFNTKQIRDRPFVFRTREMQIEHWLVECSRIILLYVRRRSREQRKSNTIRYHTNTHKDVAAPKVSRNLPHGERAQVVVMRRACFTRRRFHHIYWHCGALWTNGDLGTYTLSTYIYIYMLAISWFWLTREIDWIASEIYIMYFLMWVGCDETLSFNLTAQVRSCVFFMQKTPIYI